MNVFSYIMGCLFVVSTLMAGLFLKLCPPKKINLWYGIKTKVTSQNQQAWDYGHRVCAITLLIYSVLSILAYIIILVLAKDFFNKYFYLRIVIGLAFALVGVITAAMTTQIKTVKRIKK